MDVKLIKAIVIGDGCLDIHKRYRNARFTCCHSVKQKDYLLWKQDLLTASGLQTRYDEFWNTTNPHTGKKALMCRIESVVSPVLTVLREMMYPRIDGFKPGVLDDLEDIHLAIIFMDDGSRAVQKKVGSTIDGKYASIPCEPWISQFRISMQAYGYGGCIQFCDWMYRKFGIRAKAYKQGNGYVVVVQRQSDKARFVDVVRPFIHPSLVYKIEGTFEKHVIRRERLSKKAPEENRAMRQSELAGNEPQEGEPKSSPRQL